MDATGLYDIYQMWHVPFWQTKLWYGILISIGCVIIIVGLIIAFWFYRKSKNRPLGEPLRSLHDMYQLLHDEREDKIVYTALVVYCKRCLCHYEGNKVIGYTDYEIIDYMQHSALTEPLKHNLIEGLHNAYQVKFAPGRISISRNNDIHAVYQGLQALHLLLDEQKKNQADSKEHS